MRYILILKGNAKWREKKPVQAVRNVFLVNVLANYAHNKA